MSDKTFAETGLDKSIPHIGILMEKKDISVYPKFLLPEGYHFIKYRQGIESEWAKLQFEVDETDSIGEAEDIFSREFLTYPWQLTNQMIFVITDSGEIAGTSSIWRGSHFGKELQRIHWVAVSPKHQNKGIAKAMITKLLDIYHELGYKDSLYLTSQTWSYKAINIYIKFGFQPYLGEKPLNWKAIDMITGEPVDFNVKNKEAWDMIFEKISNK